jgi:iron(II)-dependent oxidoreductase
MAPVHSPTRSEAELRQTLRARLADARRETDALFALVRPEAMLDRPIPARHRILFYVGHLEAFDRNLILRDSLGRPSFDEAFDRLFAFGIDPVGGGLPEDVPADWPAIEEVEAYDARARAEVDDALASAPLGDTAVPNLRDGWALGLAIEHRLMHAETLAYMLHELPYDAKAAGPAPVPGEPPPRRLVPVPRGRATLGASRGDGPGLGWDNEYDLHVVEVPAFAMESHDVTCGDFLEFVRQGGYEEPSLWDDESWRWRSGAGLRHPRRWVERSGAWRYRGMFAEVPLCPAWPVYVSHAEAQAYARWRGLSLPTEAQFHRAAYGTPGGAERPFPWGSAEPVASCHGVFGFSSWDPAPVGAHPSGDSAFGLADLVGNGWEWTATPFAPFPGFEALPFYRGYSADFFDGRHYVMKGAAPRTALPFLRRSFRNWFQPHYPHPDATFRCVEPRE